MSVRPERRLLILAPFPPRLDATHGGGRSVAKLVQLHATRNRVALLALRQPGEPGVDAAVAALCELVHEVERVPIGRSLQVAWRERQRAVCLARGMPLWAASVSTREYARSVVRLCSEWQPHVVQAEFGVMGPYLSAAPRPARRLLVEHDPGIRRNGNAVARWSRRRLVRASAADAVVVFTKEDEAAMRAALPTSVPVTTIPLAWRLPSPALDPLGSDPPTVLFVGSFRHPPNVGAARRLVALLPELRRRRPDVVLALVGEEPPADLAAAGAIVPGRVDDVEPWLASAAVVAVPVAEGGGTRVKVIEALAAGKAVVGTRLAFEGLDVEDGRDVAVADDDAAFVAAVTRLLADPGERRRLGTAAHAWAERLPAADDVEDAYESLYRELGA
jgi:glycosyltransferase involved in cell wall biosynthesis